MKALFHKLFLQADGMPFSITYPDDTIHHYGSDGPPKFNLIFKTEKAMRAMLVNVDLGFGEAYMLGDIQLDGKMSDLMTMVMTSDLISDFRKVMFHPLNVLRHLPSHLRLAWQYFSQPNTYENDKRFISSTYDLGNEFYALWLDRDMHYTCGYFKTPQDTIDQAQQQKSDHVCRKLQLQPGETLLDIGCGWGGLMIYAARHYGISGLGVTLSKEQASEANRRISAAGLQERIRVIHADYRDIPDLGQVFDKVASVGCFEHIGKSNHQQFLSIARQVIKPGGTFLLHTIGKLTPGRPGAFSNKYIFPGAYIPTLTEICQSLASLDMRVYDVENLHRHYSLTAQRWLNKFHEQRNQICEMYDEQFFRMFDIYLSNAVPMMNFGRNELFQLIITPGADPNRPLTRDFIYNADSMPNRWHAQAEISPT